MSRKYHVFESITNSTTGTPPTLYCIDEPFAYIGHINEVQEPGVIYKSFFASLLMGTYLSREGCMCFAPASSKNKVLYIDTKNPLAVTARTASRVQMLCGWPTTEANARFIILNLTENKPEERQEILFSTIKQEEPTAIFIRNIYDLIAKRNDPKETAELLDTLCTMGRKYSFTTWLTLPAIGSLGRFIAHEEQGEKQNDQAQASITFYRKEWI